jgi:hypothetical protein
VHGFESLVERQIREAQERGEFDNLPGSGKPLPDLRTDDPDWWVKRLIERERLDISGAMPTVLSLRKEAETFPESLLDLQTEQSVRTVLEDYNRRVKLDRLRPAVGNLPPTIARTVDVDDLVEQWRLLREERVERERAAAEAAAAAARQNRLVGEAVRRRQWTVWRRLLRRG